TLYRRRSPGDSRTECVKYVAEGLGIAEWENKNKSRAVTGVPNTRAPGLRCCCAIWDGNTRAPGLRCCCAIWDGNDPGFGLLGGEGASTQSRVATADRSPGRNRGRQQTRFWFAGVMEPWVPNRKGNYLAAAGRVPHSSWFSMCGKRRFTGTDPP